MDEPPFAGQLCVCVGEEIHMERFPYNDFLFQKYDEEPLLPEDSDTTGDGD